MTQHTRIAVLGAGAWGTALAHILSSAGKHVTLYARDPGLAERITATRINDTYLPGISVHAGLTVTVGLAEALNGADIILLTTPTQFLRPLLQKSAPHAGKDAAIISCAKGIEIASGRLISEVIAENLPGHPFAVLSGPNFAHEIAARLPAAATLAGTAPTEQLRRWAEILRTPEFRPYLSHDPRGVEIAGALKNVIAIACGMAEGRGLGQNARAAVMTRGMAEIRRFGLAKGAQSDTFLGLAGFGDLTLTCNSMSSRNFSLGADLARGKTLDDISKSRKSVAEGVATAEAASLIAVKDGIDLPIITGVNAVLHHRAAIDDVMHSLLSRQIKEETR
jgi:glycerol-3-phosphate dehydrogenase (NAD(P)+)